MLERVLIPDNILDRLARLEERLADLEAGAVTVQVVETPSGSGNTLNGWLATGSAFQDLLGRIVLDASLPGIRLDSGGVIYSTNYQAGVSGFKIDGGTAEFNNVVVRGTVYASLGQIGGWSIGASALTGGNATLHSGGYLLLGTGNDVARIDAADMTYRLWIGNAIASSAPFRVEKTGALTATNATIVGTVTATAGAIGGWSVSTSALTGGSATLHSSGYLLLGTGNDIARIDAADTTYRLWVGNATASNAPFRVAKGGALTATNATITGSVTATSGSIGGWTIGTSALTGGNATLHSSGYLLLGTGNDIARIDAVDATFRLWVGNATASSAPFRVTKAGALTATSANITGTVTATAGAIGGWSISSDRISATNARLISGAANAARLEVGTGTDANTAGVNSPGAAGDIAFWAGATHTNRASAPFRVTAAGALTATNAAITGSVTATSGSIGGWSVGASALTGGNATLHSSGYLLLGTGNDIARIDAADTTYRLWVGNATASSAPFRVEKTGALVATNATITGTINATAGTLGSLTVTGTLTVGASTPTIQIDGSNKRIQSSNYSTGLAGFRINASGDAEFNNVVLRGTLRASTFLYGQILATGGTVVIAKASGRLYADCTTGSTFNVDVADPDGMSHSAAGGLWAVNDIIRLKDPAVGDTWAKITGKTDMTTYWRLAVSLQSGSSGVTFRAGTAVVNYGQSGQGVLWLTADDSNAPFYSVRTHTGSPWSAITELARLGNLNGNWGYTSATYGIALGEYASNKANLTWDPTNGLRLRTYSTTVLQLDNSGSATIAGVLSIGLAGGIYQGTGSFSNPQTGLKIWNDGGIGRLATYRNGQSQVYFGTDGVLYAGNGAVQLSSNGLRLTASMTNPPSRIAWSEQQSTIAEGYAYLVSDGTHLKTAVHFGTSTTEVDFSYTVGFPPYSLMTISDDGIPVFAVRTFNRTTSTIFYTIPIGCRVYATTSQNIPHNTVTALSFNTEAEDVGDCWSSSNPTRLVAPVAGYYIFGGEWSLAANQNPGGFRVLVGLRRNGTTWIATNVVHTVANKTVDVSVTGSCYLNAGDYIEICAFQDSGSTRPTNVSTDPNYQHMVHGWLRRLA